jgi:hypothetical protein
MLKIHWKKMNCGLVLLLLLNLSLGLEETEEVSQRDKKPYRLHTFLIAIDFSSPFTGLQRS